MIGRALLRFPVRARLQQTTTVLRGQHDVPASFPTVLAFRPYATPGRPKKIVGEPSRPVKRAVKKAASKPNTGDSAAEGKVEAKKRTATKKKKTAKKTPLTDEEKAAQQEKAALKKERSKASAEKNKIKALRQLALKPPQVGLASAWNQFFAEKIKGLDFSGTQEERRQTVADGTRAAGAEWRAMSAADIEHYNHLANEKRIASQAEYKRWVESHSAEEIQQANNARLQLRRHEKRGKKTCSKWPPIRDERAVKRPLTRYAQFAVNRHASGDFKNISFADRAKLISAEWKALSEDEKKKYSSLYDQDKDRYVSEFRDTYGHEPGFLAANGRAEAVAAAA